MRDFKTVPFSITTALIETLYDAAERYALDQDSMVVVEYLEDGFTVTVSSAAPACCVPLEAVRGS